MDTSEGTLSQTEGIVLGAARSVQEVIEAVKGRSDGSDRANIALIYCRGSLLHIDAFFTLLGSRGSNRLSMTAGVHLRVAVELHLRALWAGFCLEDESLWDHLDGDTGVQFKKLIDSLKIASDRKELEAADRNALLTSIALLEPLIGEPWGVLCSHAHGGSHVFHASYMTFKQEPVFRDRDLLAMVSLGVRLAAHTSVFASQILADNAAYQTCADTLVAWTNFLGNLSLEPLGLTRVNHIETTDHG